MFDDSNFLVPNADGAIGPNGQFAELINGAYSVYDAGQGTLTRRMTSDQFWSGAGITLGDGYVSDPRILYDVASDRWFASAITVPTDPAQGFAPNEYLVAVSRASDLSAGWQGMAIASNPAGAAPGSLFGDFDTLGVNSDGLYLASNMYDPAEHATGVSILTVPMAGLLAAQPTGIGSTLLYNQPAYETGYTVQPVVNLDADAHTEWMLSAYSGTSYLKLSAIGGNASAQTLGASAGFIPVTAYNEPFAARQPGDASPLYTLDSRLTASAVEKNGEIWAVQTVGVVDPATGARHDGLRWVRVDAATQTLIEEGLIADAQHDYFYGSIAVNGQGDVVIGCTRSGPDEFAGSYALVGRTTGSGTTFGNPLLLQPGAGPYEQLAGGVNRWGDFSSTMVDPTDPLQFWTIQEVAGAGNTWATQVTGLSVRPAAAAQAVVPEPSSLALVAPGLLILLVALGRARRARRC